MFDTEEKKKLNEFSQLMGDEIQNDESEKTGASDNSGAENNSFSKPQGITLGELLARLGGGDKPAIFVLQKIRAILVKITSKGLTEKSVRDLRDHAQALAKNDDFKAELLMDAIREAGFELDTRVSSLTALGVVMSYDFLSLNSYAKSLGKDEKDSDDLENLDREGGEK